MEINKYQYYALAQKLDLEDSVKANGLKERLRPFASVQTLKEAHELAEKIIPTKWPFMSFYVGNAKCSVLNKPDAFRVCVETSDEFICYDFS